MDSETKVTIKYHSLEDIKHQKEMALTKIRSNNKEMSFLWKTLTERPKQSSGKTFTFSNVMKTGIGVFDGLLLVWKLYRKFKR